MMVALKFSPLHFRHALSNAGWFIRRGSKGGTAAERDEVLRQDGAAGRAARHPSRTPGKGAVHRRHVFALTKLPGIPKRKEGPVGDRAF